MDDPESRRSLADDAKFLASLSDLDAGLMPETKRRAPPTDPVAQPEPVPIVTEPRPAPPRAPLVPPGAARGQAPPPRLPVRYPAPSAPPPAPPASPYGIFYGLHDEPFGSDPDPKFVYRSTSHDRVLQDLLNAVHARAPVVVVVGARGIGKTMLCHAFAQVLEHSAAVTYVADPPASTAALRHAIDRAERDAVLIVDNAHTASRAALRDICALASIGDRRAVQLVLAGEPSIDGVIPAGAPRFELGPLERDEIAGYIVQRLARAGTSSRVEFDEGASEAVFRLSYGVPRVVNLLCDRALTRASERSASVIDRALVAHAGEEIELPAPPPEPAAGAVPLAVAGAVLAALVAAGAAIAYVLFR